MDQDCAADGAPTRTLAIVKPDAFAAADEILHIAQLAGFTVLQRRTLRLAPARAEAFYAEHRGRPFFPGLVEFMASGPVVVAALARPGAVAAWRRLLGPTNAADARVAAPRSVRALYGTDGTRNAAHGSDSDASAARELRFFFPALPAPAPPPGGGPGVGASTATSAAGAAEYAAQHLRPVLVKALTALAKAKPSSSEAEALAFLARWLIDNNPNRPKQLVPEAVRLEANSVAAAAAAATAAAVAAKEAEKQRQQAIGVDARALPLAAVAAASHEQGAEPNQTQRDAAATKVQAAFRGHQSRQQTAEMRAAADTSE